MDEFTLMFGRQRIQGCPWHGRIQGGVLTLANTTTRTGFVTGHRGSLRLQVPGVPAVSRTPEELAADTAAGRVWRTDVAISLQDGSSDLYLYGANRITAQSIYAVGPGNCWAARFPFSVVVNVDRTALTEPATFRLISQLGYLPPDTYQSVTVTLSGYVAAPAVNPAFTSITWDCLPNGSRAVLADFTTISRFGYQMPSTLYGFAELQCSGAGTPDSPFAAVLQLLSEGNGCDEQTAEDNLTTWTGVWGWEVDTTTESIDVPGRDCPTIRQTDNKSTFYLDPDGIPSVNTPGTSITTGTRTASVTGFALGFWYSPTGELQPVTLDATYALESTHSAAGEGIGAPPRVYETEQELSLGACTPTDPELTVAGSYNWDWLETHTTTENLLLILRVDGEEIDRHELRYEYTRTSEYSEVSGFAVNDGPSATGGTQTISAVLLLDGEEFDSTLTTGAGGAALGALITPTKRLDTTGRFESGTPNNWLPQLSNSDMRLGDGYTHVWRCYVHWWSNHLVCLREETKSLPNLRLNDRYGFTAYPGGVTATRITSSAPSAFANAPPLYGSRHPLTGFVELGKTQPFSFV
mgnify:CR=1 FL=1|jgi:hypothetical protein